MLPSTLKQPTQGLGRAALNRPSTWPCSRWGFPCRSRYRLRGGLLPHRFTLTRRGSRSGGLISVALSSRFSSPGIARHLALRSPDFPPVANAAGEHLSYLDDPDTSTLEVSRHYEHQSIKR